MTTLAENLHKNVDKTVTKINSKEFWEGKAKSDIQHFLKLTNDASLRGCHNFVPHSCESVNFSSRDHINYVAEFFAKQGCRVEITNDLHHGGYEIRKIEWYNIINSPRTWKQYFKGIKTSGVFFERSSYD